MSESAESPPDVDDLVELEVDEPEPELPPPPSDPRILNQEILQELRRLNSALERFNRARRHINLSFLGGIWRGFGAAVGATLVFAIVIALVSRLVTVPVVGRYVKDVVDFVRANSAATFIMGTNGEDHASPTPTATPDADL